MVMSRDQNAGQYSNINIGINTIKRMEQAKYLGKTLTTQNSIYEKIRSREVRECLLSFSAESFVFQFFIQKCKD
jgi:hypothetical protein